MDDTAAQLPVTPNQPPSDPSTVNEPILSYVDNYAPPAASPSMTPGMPPQATPAPVMSPSMPDTPPMVVAPPPEPYTPPAATMTAPAESAPDEPTPAAPAVPAESAPAESSGQSLEEQNIFDMLGAGEASDQEKESFLDELQQVIWEDFLENDVELLITEAEKVELKQIQDKTYPSDLEKQEAIVVFLEKLIPDLEDIMLEKALELKRDMFMERLAGMKDTFAGQSDKLSAISTIENFVSQDKWGEAVTGLNQLA